MLRRLVRSPWPFVFIVFIIFFFRLVSLHCWPDPRVLSRGQSQYWKHISLSTDRGPIIDSQGRVLAISVPSFSFFVDPEFWDPSDAARLTGYFPTQTIKRLSGDLKGRYVPVARKIKYERGSEIMDIGLPGLYAVPEKKRMYVNGSLMSHVLGYCDIDDNGLSGTELIWEKVLFSPPETKILVKDASGLNFNISDISLINHLEDPGMVRLTLDSTLQYIVEKHLEEGVELHKARWGAAVCMDPNNGSILAMASVPDFDPNDRKTFLKPGAMRNNCIGRVYEPGSTFKPITVGIAIEEGLVNKSDTFKCTRRIKVADKYISDPKAYGILSLKDVIVKSSNVGMSRIGIKIDPYNTYNTFLNWGFGNPAGLELNGSEVGLIPSPDKWKGVVPANIAIGQGLAVSPLKLTTAFCAIANGGCLLRPYLVEEATTSDNKVIYKGKRNPRYQVLSKDTSEWLKHVLRDVVVEGTGRKVNTPLVPIAGKTGTAQVAEKGEYQEDRWVSSFAGFWPSDKPEYVMVVVIGEPTMGIYYGGSVAGPVFRKIVEDMLYLENI